MDTSPSKRRKLSPIASAAIEASTPREPPVTRDGPQTTSSRASFLSPTKSSLARFHPSLLPRPKSAGTGAQRRESLRSDGSNTPSRGLNPVALRTTTPPGSPESNVVARLRAHTVSPARNSLALGNSFRAAPRRKSRTPGRQSSSGTLGPASATLKLQASPIRATNLSEEVVQNTLDEQLVLELQAISSKETRGRAVQSEDGEPELPLTPTQLGLEPAAEPHRGLLYSSPLRRNGKRKSSGMKSSPLKPREVAPPSSDLGQTHPQSGSPSTHGRKVIENETSVDDQEETGKKDTLHQLLRQLSDIRGDISQLERDLGRSGGGSQDEMDGLLSIVLATNSSLERNATPAQSTPLSTRLSYFLPFSKPPAPRKDPSPTTELPVPSHKPIQLKDPLPHLRAFTPLTVTSIDTLVPSSGSDEPLLQHHDITLKSPHELLKLELRLSVDSSDQTINSLDLFSVSPWAEVELGRWARKQAATGDIASIGWACGRYWDVASIRARCWSRCCTMFPNLLSTIFSEDDVKTAGDRHGKAPFSRQTGGKRKGEVAEEEDDRSGEERQSDGELPSELPSEIHVRRSSLLMHLGRQSLLLTQASVSLLISWSISFDWTGEAESHVSATTSFPPSWRDADERASLGKVGDVFDRLVGERGVFEAVRVVVALLFEE